MVNLEANRQKIPFIKILIYLLLVLAVIMLLFSWNRISLFIHTLFRFSN